MNNAYPNTNLYINGHWKPASAGETLEVINPATEEIIGHVAHARKDDLDEALFAASKAFQQWKEVNSYERYRILRKAADLLRERQEKIAKIMTIEHGKPLGESRAEVILSADITDWLAEEARRAYGRIIPSRSSDVYQMVVKEPVGPVAGFSPWNFPINQAVRKIGGAVAAGCSIIIKGPEETPASCAELVKAYVEAGLPDGLINLVFGIPSEISEYLIPHPIIRKISFTGSTVVGKKLAAMAGTHMKLVTMELGGHAPAIIFEDADVDKAVNLIATNKYRNAGQVCVSPTRFLVHENLYDKFVEGFIEVSKNIQVGDGLDKNTSMGPLAHDRRLDAMSNFVSDAQEKGAKIKSGGHRKGNKGYFFEPTVLTDVPNDAKIMNEEPFGPLAPIAPFNSFESVVEEANRLPYGLAAFAFTNSAKTAEKISSSIESGIVSVNQPWMPVVEVPFGGIKDSGYGKELGTEGLEAYMQSKFITQKSSI
mgnify:FL=1